MQRAGVCCRGAMDWLLCSALPLPAVCARARVTLYRYTLTWATVCVFAAALLAFPVRARASSQGLTWWHTAPARGLADGMVQPSSSEQHAPAAADQTRQPHQTHS